MLRWILAVVLLALLGLVLSARLRPTPVGVSVSQSGATAPSPDSTDHSTRAPLTVETYRPLDTLARATIRLRLGTEPERHYLDSLLNARDSTVRRWPDDGGVRSFAIIAGGSRDYTPALTEEFRWAVDQWNAAIAGVRFLEHPDTAGAELTVRWVDTLDGVRAGTTDITWDQNGRIRHVDITLATRFRNSGQLLAPQTRRAIVLHEVGHALGLPHSSHREDVMFPIATVTYPTDRDRFSLTLLYQLPAGWVGVGPPVRRP